MKILLVLALAIAATQAINYDAEWEKFKLKYEKSYDRSADEHDKRKDVFISNLKIIQKHNEGHARGLHSSTLIVNKFADLTSEEFLRSHTGYKQRSSQPPIQIDDIQPVGEVPDSIDWREKGYVTPVKDQGHCGSCWAFSAVATMEGAWFKKTGNLVSLSEEQLVDCDKDDGEEDDGCAGGYTPHGIDYVIRAGYIDTEESYPYTSRNCSVQQVRCHTCMARSGVPGASFKKVVNVPATEEALKIAVATQGPISVAIDATESLQIWGSGLQFHHRGVYYGTDCSSDFLNHAVTVVGYGTENGQDYWLVKNSWGSDWGEEGYIKMSRNRNNNCGIASQPCYAVA